MHFLDDYYRPSVPASRELAGAMGPTKVKWRRFIKSPGAPTPCLEGCFIPVYTTVGLVLKADEQVLIESAQQGEREAFAGLVKHYWDRLYRWLYHLTHDRHLAEDLVQESFLKGFRALASFQAGTNFQAWLFRIAHNALANQRRGSRKVREPFPEQVPALEAGPAEQAMSR